MMKKMMPVLVLMAVAMGEAACGGVDDEHGPCAGITCSDHGTCVDQSGTAECQCDEGYRPEGFDCVEDTCAGVSWIASTDAHDAPVSEGALQLSASGEQMPGISYSISGGFDVSFLVEGLTAGAEVDFAAIGGNKQIIAAMQPDLAMAGWVNQVSETETDSDFIDNAGTGNAGQLRIQRSGNNFTATATVGSGESSHSYVIQTTTVELRLWLESSSGDPVWASVTEFQVESGSIADDTFDCDNLVRQ